MLTTVRAVVRRGKIELLEEIHIPEGTELLVTVLTDSIEYTDFKFVPEQPPYSATTRNIVEPIPLSFEDRFSETGKRVLRRAIEESRRREHNLLLLVHIFVAIKEEENELFTKGMQAVNADPKDVSEQLEQELAKIQQHVGRRIRIDDSTRELFNRSLRHARKQGRQTIEAADLFLNLFAEPSGAPIEILRRLGADTRLIDSA